MNLKFETMMQDIQGELFKNNYTCFKHLNESNCQKQEKASISSVS